jgi:hypothetical protein
MDSRGFFLSKQTLFLLGFIISIFSHKMSVSRHDRGASELSEQRDLGPQVFYSFKT